MKKFNRLALTWKLGLGFAAPVVVMLLLSGLVYQSLGTLLTSSRWVNHTHEAVELGNNLTAAMVDMETGLRGYLVTGREEFLEPYHGGQKHFDATLATSLKHVSDNAEQVARLNQVGKLKEDWLSQHAHPAIKQRKDVNAGAIATKKFKTLSKRTVGKEKFDAFRAAMAKLDASFVQAHDTHARALTQAIVMDMVNMETGQRGFLLTGLEQSLEPFVAGKASLGKHVAELTDKLNNAYGRADAKANIQAIQQLKQRWIKEVTEVGIALRRAGNSAAVQSLIDSGSGKRYFDQIRTHARALETAFRKSNDGNALQFLTNATKALVDMETGYRGFLLTGEDPSLEPYQAGKEAFARAEANLSGQVQSIYDIAAAQSNLANANALAQDWASAAAIPEIEARRAMNQFTTTLEDITAFIQEGHGKARMDNIRVVLDDFVGAEQKLIGARTEEARQVAGQTTNITVFGAVGAGLLAFVITMLLTRNVRNSLGADPVRLQEVTEAIADGDLDIDLGSQDGSVGVYRSMQKMQTQLRDSIEADRLKSMENGRVKQALDKVTSNVMMADADLNIIYMNDTVIDMFRNAEADIRKDLPAFNTQKLLGASIDSFHENPAHQRGMLAALDKTFTGTIKLGGRTFRIIANPVVDENGERLGTVVEWADRTQEVAVEVEVETIVNAAMAGDLSQRISLDDKSEFFERLGRGINELVDVSERVINDTVRMFAALSHGDLEQSIDADYQGTFGELKRDANSTSAKLREVMKEDMARVLSALAEGNLTETITRENQGTFAELSANVNRTVEKLKSIVGQISESSTLVAGGSTEISLGNDNLSKRTEQQASSLEETAASMEEMTATVQQNAENAQEANRLALSAREQAERGGEVVAQAVGAMRAISDSSREISDIIGVIDEIAFQTNLLALNASVEAARAGEQGRGFAVVASEVRNLAGRSASAAKEIKELIEDSVKKVNDGAKLVDESGDTLTEIVGGVKQVTDIVSDIAAASQEQSSGIEQVNQAVMQMDQMTQQNAALVEEASAASATMGDQADKLRKLVGFFKTGEAAKSAPIKETHPPAASPSAPQSPSSVERRSTARPWSASNSHHSKTVAAPKLRVATQNATDDDWEEF